MGISVPYFPVEEESMINIIKWIFGGKSPTDGKINCPECDYSDTLRAFASWEKDGKRGLRGKLPTGHLVVACPGCGTEVKYDPLSGKVEKML